MFRSIRFKLLVLYVGIAATTAIAFGSLTYFNVRYATYSAVDARLQELAQALYAVLTPNAGGTYTIELSDYQLDVFHRDEEHTFYYRILSDQLTEIDCSHPANDIPPMTAASRRVRGRNREIAIEGPTGSQILVGKSIRVELQQLHQLAATSMVAGLVVVVPMLVGGWLLTSRALAPINRISAAAVKISASRLSERIAVTQMESELAGLAQTINSAFDRLQLAVELQTRFTADASHELRTPLSIVLLHADRALKKPRSVAEYREVLEAVQIAAKRMQSVVEGLLTLAKGDSPRNQLTLEPLSLDVLIQEICQLHSLAAEAKGLCINMKLMPVVVSGNQALLGEAISNLVGNAIKFSPAQGRITIHLQREGVVTTLSVADDGPGIASDDQPHVFDRFYRADKARSSCADGGVGLGLAIAKCIIGSHGGQIWLSSELGHGSTFYVKLPAT